MATATAKTQTVTTTTVNLTLSLDEVELLRTIFWRVGGCPRKSRRMHADAMSNALRDALAAAGLPSCREPKCDDLAGSSNGFQFNDGGL
jgi:hypothetical protein